MTFMQLALLRYIGGRGVAFALRCMNMQTLLVSAYALRNREALFD